MSEPVVRLAAEIYSPFDARESLRLRSYVADVEEFVGSAFFQPGEQKLTLSAEMGGPLQSTLTYPRRGSGPRCRRTVLPALQPSRAYELPPDPQATQPARP
jgi:hypothetical protein